ncbi:scp-like extracellular protein [Xylariaceae sp. FL0016]|nr:scp-like extracellular protein [Xylariaceae sp. FL0016]
MKSSVFAVATAATLAYAKPFEKRQVIETDVVVDYYTVTVTGAAQETHWTVAAEEAEPTTTTQEPAVVWVTVTPDAAPATTSTPSVVYVTETLGAESYPTAEAVDSSTESSTTSSSAAEPTEPASDDMASAALYHHNLHRANHSAPEMTYSDKFAGYAANTAATCKFAHDMNQGDKGYGQNIAMWAVSSGAAALGEAGAIKMATTDMWYNGEFSKFLPQYYGEATPDMSDFEGWGHISQLLWKSSTELGCHAQFCAKGTMYDDMDAWFMVCNYGPPGNVGGAYGTNVLKPLGKPIVTA